MQIRQLNINLRCVFCDELLVNFIADFIYSTTGILEHGGRTFIVYYFCVLMSFLKHFASMLKTLLGHYPRSESPAQLLLYVPFE